MSFVKKQHPPPSLSDELFEITESSMTTDAQPYALIAPPCPLPLFSARLALIVQLRIVSNVMLTA